MTSVFSKFPNPIINKKSVRNVYNVGSKKAIFVGYWLRENVPLLGGTTLHSFQLLLEIRKSVSDGQQEIDSCSRSIYPKPFMDSIDDCAGRN